ncbi:MAG: EAL domain-containing protein, partial [[Clostridium] leptum]
LPRRHFKDPDALAKLQKIAEDNGVPTDLLELELTESIFFNDRGIEYVKKQIQEMHRIGFRCSLDDFGAGYSSLGLLMEFDVDVVKLDRRFFLDVGRKKARDVVTAITELAQKIGAKTVAEGIETQEQLDFVKEARCDMIQGYIYARPMPVSEFERWIDQRQSPGNTN